MRQKLIRIPVGICIFTALFLSLGCPSPNTNTVNTPANNATDSTANSTGPANNANSANSGQANTGDLPVPELDCATATESEVVEAIFRRLYADQGLSSQIETLRLGYKDGVLTIEKGVLYGGPANLEKLDSYLTDVACVKKIASQDLVWHRENIPPVELCPPGQKRCKEKCIPEEEKCPQGMCGSGTRPCGDICLDEKEFCPRGGSSGGGEN